MLFEVCVCVCCMYLNTAITRCKLYSAAVMWQQYYKLRGTHASNVTHIPIYQLRHPKVSILAHCAFSKVSKDAKIRNRYNQVPHLTQDTRGKETDSQLDTTNESQEVSYFPTGDHKAHINRRAQRHSKHKTEKNKKRSTKEV